MYAYRAKRYRRKTGEKTKTREKRQRKFVNMTFLADPRISILLSADIIR